MEKKKQFLAWIMAFIVAFTTMPGSSLLAFKVTGGGFVDDNSELSGGTQYSTDNLRTIYSSGALVEGTTAPVLWAGDSITGIEKGSSVNPATVVCIDANSSDFSKDSYFGDNYEGVTNYKVGTDENNAYWYIFKYEDKDTYSTDTFTLQGVSKPSITHAVIISQTTTSAVLKYEFTPGSCGYDDETQLSRPCHVKHVKFYIVEGEATDVNSISDDMLKRKAAKDVDIAKSTSDTYEFIGLEEGKEYTAVIGLVDENGVEVKEKSNAFTTKNPNITTPEVSNIGTTTVDVSATVDLGYKGKSDIDKCGFEYTINGTEEWKTVSETLTDSTSTLSGKLTNLTEGTAYDVRAFITFKGETGKILSDKKKIVTESPEPTTDPAISAPAVSASTNKAALSATISLGTNNGDLSDYGFKYKLSSADTYENKLDKTQVTKDGLKISATLTGLKSNTKYDVMSYIVVNGTTTTSSAIQFKTKSSNSSSSGDSSSGGSSSTPKADDSKQITSDGVKIPYTDNGDGTGTIKLTNDLIKQLIDKNGYISLDLSSSSLTGWIFIIPGEWFSQEGKMQGLLVKGFSTMVINDKMLRKLNIQKDDEVMFTIKKGSIIMDMKINGRTVDTVDKAHPIYVAYNTTSSLDENSVIIQKDNKNAVLPLCVPGSAAKQMLFLTPGFGEYEVKDNHKAFTDVAGNKAEKAINFVSARGLLTGVTDSSFAPNGTMTRGMFVTILGRLYGADTTMTSSFTDVNPSVYYAPYVAWASENHIVDGIGNNKFAPEKPVTHEEMAKILNNYMSFAEQSLPKTDAAAFSDAASINSWAKEGVEVLQSSGVFDGAMAERFMPQQAATRAEISTVLMNYMTAFVNESGKVADAE